MAVRTSEAQWEGSLREGRGTMKLGSGAFEGNYSFPSRFESGQGSNPEELIGAAHAGCFSMAFANGLTRAGFTPTRIHTNASVHLDSVDGGFAITRIDLKTEAAVRILMRPLFRSRLKPQKPIARFQKCLLARTYISTRSSWRGRPPRNRSG